MCANTCAFLFMPPFGYSGVRIFLLAKCAKEFEKGRKIILTFFILNSPLFGLLIVIFSLSLSSDCWAVFTGRGM